MKVSIITATYNSGKTIENTIESVISQKFNGEIEYIIIDGGSKDDTLSIINKYKHHISHIVSEKDKGLYDAMNKGIHLASGEIIGILNSDDFFTSTDVIAKISNEFERHPELDAVYGDVHFVDPNDLEMCVRYFSSKHFSPSRLRFGFMPAHPAFYLKKSCYDKYGLYDINFKIAADYDLMVRLFHNHKIKAKYIEKDIVTMRTGGMSTKNLNSRIKGTQEDLLACRKNGLYSNICFIYSKYLFKIFELKLPINKGKRNDKNRH